MAKPYADAPNNMATENRMAQSIRKTTSLKEESTAMKQLNPRALEFLNAIERYGSLRKAAVKLNVDPSAISRALSQQEEKLGVSIWDRANNNNLITPSGQELLHYFRRMQASEAVTISKIHDLLGLRAGEVRLAIGEGFITDLISTSLQSFLNQYPGIQLSVQMAGAKEAIQLLEDDQIDFAVTYASVNQPSFLCHIETIHPLDIIAPIHHPLSQLKRKIDIREVVNFPLALIDQSTGMGRLVNIAEETGGISLVPRLRTNSVAVLKNFVSSGAGITFMPRLTVQSEVNEGTIAVVETNHDILSQAKARVLSKKERELTLPAKALLTHLQNSTQFLNHDAPQDMLSFLQHE